MTCQIVILLPIYNYNRDWLREQLESIADQTHSSFDCVVSNDGNLDSVQIAELQSVLPDDRFKLIAQNRHLGLYTHIANLVQTHTPDYKYFVLCDQDDVWVRERLEKQVEHIEGSGASVVSSNAEIVNDNLDGIKRRTNFAWFGIKKQNLKYGLVLNQLTGASGIYRQKDFIKSLPFPRIVNEKVCIHDHWLYLCAIAAGGIEFSEECLWKYRQHKSNMIGAAALVGSSRRYIRGLRKAIKILERKFIHDYDPVIEQGLVFQEALIDRFPEINKKLLFIGAKDESMTFINKIKMVRDTNLEGFRLLVHRKRISRLL
jgi:glycosyltransferase involved in cell wall biosynthesis